MRVRRLAVVDTQEEDGGEAFLLHVGLAAVRYLAAPFRLFHGAVRRISGAVRLPAGDLLSEEKRGDKRDQQENACDDVGKSDAAVAHDLLILAVRGLGPGGTGVMRQIGGAS